MVAVMVEVGLAVLQAAVAAQSAPPRACSVGLTGLDALAAVASEVVPLVAVPQEEGALEEEAKEVEAEVRGVKVAAMLEVAGLAVTAAAAGVRLERLLAFRAGRPAEAEQLVGVLVEVAREAVVMEVAEEAWARLEEVYLVTDEAAEVQVAAAELQELRMGQRVAVRDAVSARRAAENVDEGAMEGGATVEAGMEVVAAATEATVEAPVEVVAGVEQVVQLPER